MTIIVFNICILTAISSGANYFKNSLENRNVFVASPLNFDEINMSYVKYVTENNKRYEIHNKGNKRILNYKKHENNKGVRLLKYGMLYFTMFLIYMSIILII